MFILASLALTLCLYPRLFNSAKWVLIFSRSGLLFLSYSWIISLLIWLFSYFYYFFTLFYCLWVTLFFFSAKVDVLLLPNDFLPPRLPLNFSFFLFPLLILGFPLLIPFYLFENVFLPKLDRLLSLFLELFFIVDKFTKNKRNHILIHFDTYSLLGSGSRIYWLGV